ncbi:MAG TPA: LD-carboxypeptidase [Gemmatimonadales bacterium]|jgi:muramoyltetrapeptide carboxypeptidase
MPPKPILPLRLRAGARVALLAPSGPLVEHDHLRRGVELCVALGYQPVLMPSAGRVHGYLAGTDDERLTDLNMALTDPDLDAAWCLRGGNGMNRIVDQVDFAGFARAPRPVIGYSDITALLLALTTTTGVVTFHGPMARAAMPRFSRQHFERMLTEPEPAGRLDQLPPRGDTLVPERGRIVTVVPGRATGHLFGGNLTLLQALIGTPYFPDLSGAILFLEDVGEDLYRIDRMLGHLRMAGVLAGVAGVAIGHFSGMRHATPEGALRLDDVLRHYFEPDGIPTARGFPIGHVTEQWTVPIGIRATLDATVGTVDVLEPAVR